jgi:hypothetical protein
MSKNALPIPESYWVEPGRFLAGEYPGRLDVESTRRRLGAFLASGLDTFIDLTSEGEMPSYQSILMEEARDYGLTVTYQRFAIGDFGLPSREGMLATLNAIDSALAAGRKVYVHCWGGIGRTGTTVGCYLARHGHSGEAALRQLAEWWQRVPKSAVHSHSPETTAQMNFVFNWKE